MMWQIDIESLGLDGGILFACKDEDNLLIVDDTGNFIKVNTLNNHKEELI